VERGARLGCYGPRTALVVVDVQNDFADRAGSLYVPGGEEVAEVVNHHVTRALEAGAFVAYTQDWHPPSTPHFAKDGGIWPVHCVKGTWGAELVPALHVAGPVVQKGTGGEDGYSGFFVRDPVTRRESPTGLALMLREHGIAKVVVVGLATDYCVKETALDALREGFETAVVKSAIRAVDLQPGDGARALEELAGAGATILED
jgi:nicotinamidase/pyrazinamidase